MRLAIAIIKVLGGDTYAMNHQIATSSWKKRSMLTVLTGVIVLSTAPMVRAQVGPFPVADDHFLCYKGRLTPGTDSAGGPANVQLADAYESGFVNIKKERGSCNPADKNGEGIVDPVTHLTVYQIKPVSGSPKHIPQLDQRLHNQFGDIYLDTIKADRLLVPANKDDDPMNPLPSPPVAANHNVDHYKCYRTKVTKGRPKFPRGLQASVEDQWETPAKVYDLKRPKLLCLAVNKNGEGIKHTYDNMVCYLAKPAKGEAKHTPRTGVGFADQFVAHRLDSKKEELLCVPSLLNPPDEFCGDEVINQSGLEECDGDDAQCAPGEICIDTCHCVAAEARCGNGIIEPGFGETCESDGDCAVGEACTTSCTCMDAQCPDTLVVTRYGDVSVSLGATDSDNDSGWTGSAHNSRIPDESTHIYRLSSVSGTGPSTCGVATVAGLDTSSRLCRCVDDNRQVCDQPNELDYDDCGGSLCRCHLDAPIASLSTNIPTCSLTEFDGDVTGTWNLDSGDGELHLPLEQTTTLSTTLLTPCPTCDGDDVLNDGVRNGTCNGGKNAGQPCDTQQVDLSLPAPGGGGYSLDCYPSGPAIVTGLLINVNYTTGTHQLDAVVPCGTGGSELCHCGGCLGNYDLPCNTNADCGADGPCGVNSATNPRPNQCTDLTCTSLGEGQGECQGGPTRTFCDGLLRADGTGLVNCNTNADCATFEANQGVPMGLCTLVELRSCYPDSIVVNGVPDVASPLIVAADCIARSPINPGANLVAGYPGPGVRHEQLGIDLKCAGDPGSSYPSCP